VRFYMVDPVSGGGHIPPQTQHIYKQEFTEGANLFQQSLQQYQNSKIPAQQEAFKDVMSKAMVVMNETAKLCLSKEAQKREAELNQAFESFQSSDSPEATKNLSKSINHLKESL
jgi:hypothetical protein